MGTRRTAAAAASLVAANLAATTTAQPPDEPTSYLRTTCVGAVTTPRMRSAMDVFMTKPIDAIRYSQPAFTLGMLHSTEEMRRWLYTQVLAVSSMLDNSFTMFYAGAEDGRFVGYYDPLRYTFRPRGEALAYSPTSAEVCVSRLCNTGHIEGSLRPAARRGDKAVSGLQPPGRQAPQYAGHALYRLQSSDGCSTAIPSAISELLCSGRLQIWPWILSGWSTQRWLDSACMHSAAAALCLSLPLQCATVDLTRPSV